VATMLAIHTEALTRDFNGTCAVDGLNLAVAPGIVYGLLGPAGSGKSTIVRLLLGLLEPTSGSAQVLGFDAHTNGHAIRARSGVVLQSPGLYTRLSVEENLNLFGRIWRLPASERATRTRELLTHFCLWERRKEAVSQLSRGLQQRLAIARSFLARPALLLLDQPTASLDPTTAELLRLDLAALVAEEGVTVLLTTENPSEAEQMCDRLAALRAGRVVAEGLPGDLLHAGAKMRLEIVGRGFTVDMVALVARRREVSAVHPMGERLWIDLEAGACAAPLVNLLVESGAEVEEVLHHQSVLETICAEAQQAAP